MNILEYEIKYELLYAEFAGVVKYVLDKAIAANSDAPRPQSIQSRAKMASHLRPKLQDRGLLDSQSIETQIKDLAGARLIFYTNADVELFLNSRLIPNNFDVRWDETKIHHPTEENAQRRYRAIHYTVCLNSERTALPEYEKFKGIRCEIQIQTILNHAWAETSHDILYKRPTTTGFGSSAMQSIEKRMTRIMDDYLLPAGYEFQKVQHDFQRLLQGKALFDRGVIESLERATNNNERHELLTALKENVLPHYDDLPAIYPDLRRDLLKVVNDANKTELQPIETPFGNLPGKTSQDVTAIIVDVLDLLRYVDPVGTFYALADIYNAENNPAERQHILKTVEHLAGYNTQVWQHVGPAVQVQLADEIERRGIDWRLKHRAVLLTAWRQFLHSEITGIAATAVDAVTFSRGSISAGKEVDNIRRKAIDGLIEIFDRTSELSERRSIITGLWEATRLPFQTGYSIELRKLVLADTKHIVDELTRRIDGQPYDLLEHIEHQLFIDYGHAKSVAQSDDDGSGCPQLGQTLVESILQFRDALNADSQFVKYKTLVGFESVFPHNWEEDSFNFSKNDQYRQQRIEEYVEEITPATQDDWHAVIERCAATKSDDMATFTAFGIFITRLATLKPGIASHFLERGSENLLNFLPAFLNGLYDSGEAEQYETAIQNLLTKGTHLTALGTHWSSRKPKASSPVKALLPKAISTGDDIAVMQCVALAIKNQGLEHQPVIDEFFVPAMEHLTNKRDARWILGAWYMPEASTFFSALSPHQTKLVLDNMLWLHQIDFRAEKILEIIAENHADAIWHYLGLRFKLADEEKQAGSYDAIPYRLSGLANRLLKDANTALRIVRSWYRPDDPLFRFRGGRLLSVVFPQFPTTFAESLCRLIADGSQDDFRFVINVLQNYEGEPATHPVLKALIARLVENDPLLEEVDIALTNTGIVNGEFGLVEAFRSKKEEITAWLTDDRPQVREFAKRLLRSLDLRIAAEHRSVEERRAMRDRDFDSIKAG